MDKYGPLYHRNSPLLANSLARFIIGVVLLLGIGALALGVISIVSLGA